LRLYQSDSHLQRVYDATAHRDHGNFLRSPGSVQQSADSNYYPNRKSNQFTVNNNLQPYTRKPNPYYTPFSDNGSISNGYPIALANKYAITKTQAQPDSEAKKHALSHHAC
jgi:hypothetical protein